MGQHWYSSTGTPEHFRGPNGSSTTLREARKLNLYPSVTTVLDVLAKPGLEVWKRRQAVLAALTLPRMPDEPSEDLLARIDADASREAKEAAEHGSAIHQAVEAMLTGNPVPERFKPHCAGVRRMLDDNYPGVTDWVVERRFAHPAGFAGCCDLHSPSTGIVIDHKSADIREGDTKQLAYSQHTQLGAYAWGLGLPPRAGANLFISRTEPGLVRFHEWSDAKMQEGRAIFEYALKIWQLTRGYVPS